ncbi:MAG: 1-acyl-sn-glycerol-3-phosphate acyltransferase [Dictyoglomus thermophilum]|nr:lysophospholipid acyltransferase family protein [Dictyoglomus thermophilum]MCX7721027.1 1-acyl-sn-glycerol-3-phosphate acyltransferase [Dictyoglomus thermophilum]
MKKIKRAISHFFYKILIIIVRFLLKILWGYKVEGKENISSRSFILVANHVSILDPIVIGAAFDKRLFYLAKKELFKSKIFNPFLRWLGAIDIDRKDFKYETWKKINKLIKENEIIVIFPEGTRNDHPEMGLLELKDGAASLALTHGLPILPVGIKGTEKIWRRKKFFPQIKGQIRIRIGKIIEIPKVRRPSKEDIKEVNEKIKVNLMELLK